jgi:hypothetical protein
MDKLFLLHAVLYYQYLQQHLTSNILFPVIAVEGDVGSNTEKLEDWLETLERLLLLLLLLAVAAGICCTCLLEAETDRKQIH